MRLEGAFGLQMFQAFGLPERTTGIGLLGYSRGPGVSGLVVNKRGGIEGEMNYAQLYDGHAERARTHNMQFQEDSSSPGLPNDYSIVGCAAEAIPKQNCSRSLHRSVQS